MQIGISTSSRGRLAAPAAVRAVAQAAEQLGFTSVWVHDEALPPGDGGRSPDDTFDPIALLAVAATVTSRVRLGAQIPVETGYSPALLARSLRTLAAMSDGRFVVGLTRGGTAGGDDPIDRIGAVLDHLDRAPPRPGVLVSTADPRAIEPLLRRSDGWHACGAPVHQLAARWEAVRHRFPSRQRHGRPILVVPAPVELTVRPVAGPRPAYRGDVDQVAADLEEASRAGAHEIVLGVRREAGLDETLDVCARLAEAVERRAPPR